MPKKAKTTSGGLEIIYSRQNTGFTRGKVYANPRFFSTPRDGVKKVYLDGPWPAVEAAYKALGVPVERLDLAPTDAEAPPPPVQPVNTAVEIPADWETMPWVGAPSMRSLAAQLTDQPVINKAQAVAVITAELQRRGTPVSTANEPEPPAA